jgi:hypothetical protein
MDKRQRTQREVDRNLVMIPAKASAGGSVMLPAYGSEIQFDDDSRDKAHQKKREQREESPGQQLFIFGNREHHSGPFAVFVG